MELRLQQFIDSIETLADIRNLDSFNPIIFRIEHPVTAHQYSVVGSKVEPSYLGVPVNTTWIVLDPTNKYYRQALKLKDTLDQINVSDYPMMDLGTGVEGWWHVVRTYEEIFYDEQYFLGIVMTGPVGPTGETGLSGATGPQGERGEKGEKGDVGAKGATGDKGATGAQGLDGAQGPIGADGPIGPTGPQGQSIVGPKGDTGVQGIPGDTGPVGPTGERGLQGLVGPTGAVGEVGPVGPTGKAGAEGPVGPQGDRGIQGIQGVIGPVGPTGATGATGATGPLGPTGTFDTGITTKGFVPVTNTDKGFDFNKIVLREIIVRNDTELQNAKSVVTSMATIYGSWTRFSHSSTGVFPANASELNAWTYDSATDSILASTNSGTYIGFVSDTSYDTYRHEVTLTSSSADDDVVAVVLAFYHDPVTGKEYTLSAVRHAGGLSGGTFMIAYNYAQMDGFALASASLTAYTNPGAGWGGKKTRIRVKRDMTSFTVDATQLEAAVGSYVSTLTVDISTLLTTHPELSVFIGPKPYGYGAYSQQNSSFQDVSFTTVTGKIYDIRDGSAWEFSGNSWVKSSSTIEELPVGRIYYSASNARLFYRDPFTKTYDIAGSGGIQGLTGNTGPVGPTGPMLEVLGATPGFVRKAANGTYTTEETPYDIGGFSNGKPLANEVIYRIIAVRSFLIKQDFAGSLAKCSTAPTSQAVLTILKNGAPIGTITFAAGSVNGVFSTTSATMPLAIGDQFAVTAPSPADATLSDLVVNVFGIQT